MKKLISVILVLAMALALLAGCAPATSAPQSLDSAPPSENKNDPTAEHHKIGVYVSEWNQNMIMMKAYYDEYIAPAFNVEFIYSDAANNLEAVIAFIENCGAMGVEAIINWLPAAGDNNIAIAAKCEEYGIYLVYNNAQTDPNLDQFPHMVAVGGAVPETVAQQYAEMTERVIGDGANHNVVVHNGLCFMGVAQHNLTGKAVLDTLGEKFNLTYSGETLDLITQTTAQTELATGTDMKVLLEPSAPQNVSPDVYFNILKDGTYDTVIFTGPMYTKIESAVMDVEKLTNQNVHLISIAAVTDTTRNSFATKDSTGNQSLDAALIKNTTSAGILFALAYNALTGHAEDLRTDGKVQLYDAPMWTCYNLEEYEMIAQLDTPGSGCYSYTIDDIKSCLFEYNEDLTVESLQTLAAAKLDLNAVLTANGLK